MHTASALCVVLLTASAIAGPSQKDLVPSGKEWFCFEGEPFSQCRRLRVECEDIRRQYEARDPSVKLGVCRQQKKAAVVTFLDVLKDKRRFIATPTFASCQKLRSTFANKEDYGELTACQAVGERRSKLQSKVPKGPFYCNATVFGRKTVGGIYGDACYRSLDECQKDLETQRTQASESDPVEIVVDCDRRDVVYAFPASDGSGVVLHTDWCDGCDLLWW